MQRSGYINESCFYKLCEESFSENKIPFEFSLDPFYSKENMERLRKSIAQMESSGSDFKDNIS